MSDDEDESTLESLDAEDSLDESTTLESSDTEDSLDELTSESSNAEDTTESSDDD